MKKTIPLFIAYFYPPAGGAGLPGSQRTVKFIRYLDGMESKYVLSIKPECYPHTLKCDFNRSLPVNGEIIVRTGAKDRFQQLMDFRQRVKATFKKRNMEPCDSVAQMPDNGYFSTKQAVSLAQRLKDFIHFSYYSPDMVSPWITEAVKAGVELVHQKKINIIFATGMPWSSLVVGHLIGKKTGVPFIADFRDPWMGNPFLKSKGKYLDWKELACERSVVSSAALITVNTEPLRDEFMERYPDLPPEKIITLPNGFDPHDFENVDLSSHVPMGHAEKLTLAHAGFLYGKRDPAPLLMAMEELCRRYPELAGLIEFHQMGGISLDYDFHKRFASLIGSGFVKLMDQMPYTECLNVLARMDVLVVIQPGTKTQVPSKLYDYLCINRPILTITPPDGALGNMIRDHNLGDLFSPEDQQALVQKLADLCDRKKNNALIPGDYPNRDVFDVRHIARLLEQKMRSIVSSGV